MVDCSQFLEGYSEFRDGRLENRTRAEYESHLTACASCSRYHRVVCGGSQIFRDLPQLRPSDDFLPRLQHRIFHLEDELRSSARHSSGASAGFTLAIAALLAAVAWIPLFQPRTPVVELPPIAARAPQPLPEVPVLFRSGPLLDPAPTAGLRWNPAPPSANALFFEYTPMGAANPYSTVRTVGNR